MTLKFTTVKTLQISDGPEKVVITPGDAHRVMDSLAPILAEVRAGLDNAAFGHSNNTVSVFERHLAILVASGMKIDAIKLHREQFRSGLKEAKDIVEELEERMFPGYFTARKAQREAAKKAIEKGTTISEFGKKAETSDDDGFQ